jgi:hypothetical protein
VRLWEVEMLGRRDGVIHSVLFQLYLPLCESCIINARKTIEEAESENKMANGLIPQ